VPETGLSACIFFAYGKFAVGKKGYRFNPLRGCHMAPDTALFFTISA
jgi:hypothetical protein